MAWLKKGKLMKHSVTVTVEIDQKFCNVLGQNAQSLITEALIRGMNTLENRYNEQVTEDLLCSKNERSNLN